MKRYTKDHEWVEIDGNEAIVGISKHAAEELGDITFVELPAEQSRIEAGESLGVIESVKAASDVYSPVGGTVVAVNSLLDDQPELVNASAEDEGWICRIAEFDAGTLDGLMDADAYAAFIKAK
jgi:glycine cleavage system H protein